MRFIGSVLTRRGLGASLMQRVKVMFSCDTLKQIILFILSALVTVIAEHFVWLGFQKEVKHLTVSIDSESTIIACGSNKIDGLDLNYKSRKIDSLSMVELTVACDGNSVLRKEDFTSPLRISFHGEIVNDPKTISQRPNQLKPNYRLVGANVVEILPFMMNDGDFFSFRIDIANLKSKKLKISTDGRIVGVSQIDPVDKREDYVPASRLKYLMFVVIAMAIVSLIIFFVKFKGHEKEVRDDHPVD